MTEGRTIVAVLTVERDAAGMYYAYSTFDDANVDPVEVGPWSTLLGCLDGMGRALLDGLYLFPRALASSMRPPKREGET